MFKYIFKASQPLFLYQFGFEPVGNFVYKTNKLELSKFLLGLHKRHIAFAYTCDVYEKGVEFLDLDDSSLTSKLWLLLRHSKFVLKQICCFLKIENPDFFLALLFKSSPEQKQLISLEKNSWQFIRLPHNPYV